ncbi:MAG: response regulator [Mariprofundus sp.]|nr:response regulator [Mariprofundus sp.]
MQQGRDNGWLLKQPSLSGSSLRRALRTQTWFKLLLAPLCLLYLWLDGIHFSHFQQPFIIIAALYLCSSALNLGITQRLSLSILITIASTFDIFLIGFAMLVDGGQASGFYFIFLAVIFSNSRHFGKPMMICSQIGTIIGLLTVTACADFYLQTGANPSLFFWQLASLIILPLYLYAEQSKHREPKPVNTNNDGDLADKSPLPLFTFALNSDHTPCLIYSNHATDELQTPFSHPQQGKPVTQLFLTNDHQEVTQFCQQLLCNENQQLPNTTQHTYLRGRNKQGHHCMFSCTGKRIFHNHRWIGICQITDITALQTEDIQLAHTLKESHIRTSFASIVHDFRNVLNNIIGYAELLQMSCEDEDIKQKSESILTAGERGSDLITKLLKQSRCSASQHRVTPTSSKSLVTSISYILNIARMQLPVHIKLNYHIDKSITAMTISTLELEQILISLIDNSSQAINASDGLIEIDITNDLQQKNTLCIMVSDNGSGIEAQDITSISKPFWSKHDRMGLGLTMVDRILKRLQGNMVIDSAVNHKTTITIQIPAEKNRTDSPPQPTAITTGSAQNMPEKHHCLIVDDVPDILKVHQALLSYMGYSSETAINGEIALQQYRQSPQSIDLIMTDYNMPVMNGLELIKAIRLFDQHVTILMVTAYAEDHHLQCANYCGVHIISKPITLEALAEAIDHI